MGKVLMLFTFSKYKLFILKTNSFSPSPLSNHSSSRDINSIFPPFMFRLKSLFIITTDGLENASRYYTYDKVRSMIERQKGCYGWEFIFLGANIDAAEESRRFGIDESMAANYRCDEVGTALNYEVISDVVTSVRMCEEPLSASWKMRIDEDYESRDAKK